MSSEAKDVVQRHLLECVCGDVDSVDDFFAVEYRHHGRSFQTRDDLRRVLRDHRAAYPEVTVTIEKLVAANDSVAAHYRLTNTATGNSLLSATMIYRVEHGRIVESWGHSDKFF